MARLLLSGSHTTRNADVTAKPAGEAGGNHPQKGMTHPGGSNRIGHKPPGSPGKGSGDPGTGPVLASEANMTSAATTTPRGTGGRRAEGSGYGLVFSGRTVSMSSAPAAGGEPVIGLSTRLPTALIMRWPLRLR
jgi:hypothetical protein